jgi:hypothetical protein
MQGAIDALTDPELSGWEKFTRVLSSLGMTVMMIVSLMGSLKLVMSRNKKDVEDNTKSTVANSLASWLNSKAKEA